MKKTRWILILPITLLLTFVFGEWSNFLFTEAGGENLPIITPLVRAFVFIVSAYIIAPSKKNEIQQGFTVIWVLSIMFYSLFFANSLLEDTHANFLFTIISSAITSTVLYTLHEIFFKKEQSN